MRVLRGTHLIGGIAGQRARAAARRGRAGVLAASGFAAAPAAAAGG
jgi:hypothetical protein